MKRIIFFLSLLIAAPAFSATKDEKCVSCLTAAQIAKRDKDRARIKKERADLRAENNRLREENKLLRNRPVAVGNIPVARSQPIAPSKPAYKSHRISGLAAWGNDGLNDRRQESIDANEVSQSKGLHLGGLYQYNINGTVNVGAGAIVPTRPHNKEPMYIGSVGFDL